MPVALLVLLSTAASASASRLANSAARVHGFPRAPVRMGPMPQFGTEMAQLRSAHASQLAQLLESTADIRDPAEHDELWTLRFVLDSPEDVAAAEAAMRATLAWQKGEGASIVSAL
jgi:hypothetical protein